jgi:hypothetical protein
MTCDPKNLKNPFGKPRNNMCMKWMKILVSSEREMDEDPQMNEDSDMDEDSRNERTLQELLLLQEAALQDGDRLAFLSVLAKPQVKRVSQESLVTA